MTRVPVFVCFCLFSTIILVIYLLICYSCFVFRELPDYSLEMIDKFLESVVEAEKSKEKKACRGPFLAQFELAKLSSQECIYSDSRQSKLILIINIFAKCFVASCVTWQLYCIILLFGVSAFRKTYPKLKGPLSPRMHCGDFA